ARLAFPLAQAPGTPAELASLLRRDERVHRRMGGFLGALQQVEGLVYQCRGTFGCTVVFHCRDGTRARLRARARVHNLLQSTRSVPWMCRGRGPAASPAPGSASASAFEPAFEGPAPSSCDGRRVSAVSLPPHAAR